MKRKQNFLVTEFWLRVNGLLLMPIVYSVTMAIAEKRKQSYTLKTLANVSIWKIL